MPSPPPAAMPTAWRKLVLAALRIELRGAEHIPSAGPLVVVANHQSFLDPLLLWLCMPSAAFVMNTHQARRWYFRPLRYVVNIVKVDPLNPLSTKRVIRHVQGGGVAVIFPEGQITTTGGIMKIYDGTGMIVERTGADVLPVRIDGAQYTYFSRMQGKLRRRIRPPITLHFFPPRALALPEAQGKERRAALALAIYDLLTETAFLAVNTRRTLLGAFHAAARTHGRGRVIVNDATDARLTYRALMVRAGVLQRILAPQLGEGKYVGLLLPTAPAAVVSFLALQGLNRVPAMLNATAGERALQAACTAAELHTIITSRAFVEKAGLVDVLAALPVLRVIYLEDVREQVKPQHKIAALLASFRPAAPQAQPDAPAVILFTSGSEGAPKGVVLSHANILANIAQTAARFDFTQRDVMFNALPVFHSFGLTAGVLLPLILGIRTFLHVSPLQYHLIPELVYDSNATILLGTDTFFNGWARYAQPLDFHRVRIAVAGAEKLKPATRARYAEAFRVNILEGYGVTETSPVLACNTPAQFRAGAVGRLFPGIRAKLEPVEGLGRGGRLHVAGANVMLGYLRSTAPGVIQPPGKWYDTGDIVEIDAQGFVYIQGRAKRFAKIGGEMVSLAAVEECAASLWPEVAHAALALADARKGERIVLVSEQTNATVEALRERAKACGLPEIASPREVRHVEALPRLGNGKIDYITLQKEIN